MVMRVACLLVLLIAPVVQGAEFASAWPAEAERVWAGREYWANPLQDWRVARGRLECVVSGQNRHVQLLTHDLGLEDGEFVLRVRLGRLSADPSDTKGWGGFRMGIRGFVDDYRNAAIWGEGLNAGITTAGELFIRAPGDPETMRDFANALPVDDIELRLAARLNGPRYTVALSAHDPLDGSLYGRVSREDIRADELVGNVALVSDWTPEGDVSPQDRSRNAPRARDVGGGDVRFWFADWRVEGTKVRAHEERAFGPILFAMHTLSRGVMKMTAQMPPLGRGDSPTVRLETRDRRGGWEAIAEEHIHSLARTATFRIVGWDASEDVPYRLAYSLRGAGGETTEHYWTGTVRREPVDRDTIVVAGFTGNQDTGFPNRETARNVEHHDPDVLVFTGDQIYENVAGYGIERSPVETATLDYLRKWWLLGWAFGDLMRDRVTVAMPDDHDVYQGNIWGGGGRKVTMATHATGGYAMPAEWVRAVERTQTAHLPDPYDPRPIEQGIGVYFTELNYGRMSFGIIEDRKFKSGPEGLTPSTGGRPDHVTDAAFDAESFDVPGAVLLGERQLAFIRDWTSDWSTADMKVSLTQTIFANAATTHGANKMRLVADLDSNGWPQEGRKRALRELHKGFVFMLGGDQHLPTIIHHGIDEFEDAGYSFSVPSIAAGYPRAWLPDAAGYNRGVEGWPAGMPEYTGRFFDGLRNRMTIWAVANPQEVLRDAPLEKLHDKASGYGILRFNKVAGTITMECWPLLVDPADPAAGGQFAGWPKTVSVEENYGRAAWGYLPEVQVSGMENPVVQVVDEGSDEVVYTLRIRGDSFRPKVFAEGRYTMRVGEPELGAVRELTGVVATRQAGGDTVRVEF